VTRLALPGFTPAFTQSYLNDADNVNTGLTFSLNNSAGSNPIKSAVITEPPALTPNFAALGSNSDRCPAQNIVSTPTPVFIRNNCPDVAKVGTATFSSPDYPTTLHGNIYMVQRGALPAFGVDFLDPALGNPSTIALPRPVIIPTLTQADPACVDSETPEGLCPLSLQLPIHGLPDVTALQSTFVFDGPDRLSATSGALSGKLFHWDGGFCDPLDVRANLGSVNGESATLTATPPIPVC
jgi:hypothetical protein